MSFQQLIARWLAAQAMQAVRNEMVSTLQGKPQAGEEPEYGLNGDEPNQLSCEDAAPPQEPEKQVVDIGFVFAMPMEAAGVVDVLKQSKTIKSNGSGGIFHTGLFEGFRVVVAQSGVGRENARKATRLLIETFEPKRILSAGYGGGLNKRLQRFNVCFPEIVMRESDKAILDLSTPIPSRLEGTPPISGKLALLTTDFVVGSAKKKLSLGRETGAELVDMETFTVADVCREKEIPFLAVRIILDTAEESLPKDIQNIMKSAEKSTARLAGSVLGSLFSRPSSMIDLFTLKQRALSATDRLARRIAAELKETRRSTIDG